MKKSFIRMLAAILWIKSSTFAGKKQKEVKMTMKKILFLAVAAVMATVTMTSCDDDENNVTNKAVEPVTLNCVMPDYLKAGDKVALISPSYFTPMENVEKTADVLRSWGLVPEIGPNVGKVVDGKYAGTVAERVSDIRWALSDPAVAATPPSNTSTS